MRRLLPLVAVVLAVASAAPAVAQTIEISPPPTLTPEGYGYSRVIVAEDFGLTIVAAFGLPLEETIKIAEGLK